MNFNNVPLVSKFQHIVSNRLHANSLYLMMNSVVTAGLGFLFWALVARLYSTENVGLGSALISAGSLLAFLGSLGLDYGIIRFLSGYENDRASLINLSITMVAVATALICIVYLAGAPLWSPTFLSIRNNLGYSVVFIVFTITWVIVGQMNAAFISFRKAELVLTQNGINSIVKLVLAVVLGSYFGSFFGIFVSWGLSAIVALVISIFFLLPRLLPKYQFKMILKVRISKELFKYSFTNYLANGFWALPQWILPLIIVSILGASENAYYYITFGVSGILFGIPGATSTSLFAEGSNNSEHLSRNLVRCLKLTMALLVPCIVLMATLGGKILLIFGHAYSTEGARLFLFLAPATLPMSITTLYIGACRVQKKLKEIMMITFGIAVGILALSSYLMRVLGIEGVAIAWLTVHTVSALVLLPKFVRLCRKVVG